MRVIAGKHRGLNLLTFEADNIRPTIDRVREGIFNKIQFNINGAKVLDLFGGTGAISIEFLSRGAETVVTVDNNKKSIDLIKKNFIKAKEKLNLIENDFKSALKNLKGNKFNFIFLDPPFDTMYGEQSINLILEYCLLEKDGIIIYEHSVDKKFILDDKVEIFDEKKYGTILVSYLRIKND